jgi:acyl-CoA synthetase (AMP-forming)/AMP-acid ligase II
MTAGDVISFQLPSWREAVAIDLAASMLGLVVNPIIPIYRERELRFILGDARTRLLFIPQTFRSVDYPKMITSLRHELPDLEHVVVVRGAANGDRLTRQTSPHNSSQIDYQTLTDSDSANLQTAAVNPESLKVLMYTSGTTGTPKAVMHSHNSLARAIDNTLEAWHLDGADLMLMPSPVTHITGYVNGIELPFFSDVKTLLMNQWQVARAAELIQRHAATLCISATPFLQELVDHAEQHNDDLSSLRLFACGGAAVPPELIRRVPQSLGQCRAFRVYGSTEVPLVSTGFTRPEQLELAATTDGKIDNWQVRVVDAEGRDMAAGQDGELWIRGPAMMLGYKDPGQTAAAMTDGYFHTGDIGHITADNAVVITDRKKDLIIRGGENISAKEVEDVLHDHPRIREAAVVAMPHQRLGECVCAFLVIDGNAPDDALINSKTLQPHLSDAGLARQKWPEKIVLIDNFERTASGKIRKNLLRAKLAN